MPREQRLPSSVTTADLQEARDILRRRAARILKEGNHSPNASARCAALNHIADYLDAKALADGG